MVNHELFDEAGLARIAAGATLVDVYRNLVADAARGIAGVVDLVDRVGPTYVHCAAGKDRTGVVVAALLLLAGVTEDAVMRDYRSTEDQMVGVLDRLVACGGLEPGSWEPEWLRAPGGRAARCA